MSRSNSEEADTTRTGSLPIAESPQASSNEAQIESTNDAQRLALFFDTNNEGLTSDYAKFLRICGFYVKQGLLQGDVKEIDSSLQEALLDSWEVQQLIVVVIAIHRCCLMKEILDFMCDGRFPGCQNKFLLFFRHGEEEQRDRDVASNFAKADFPHGSATIAYKADTTEGIKNFFVNFVIDAEKRWETESIFSIISHPSSAEIDSKLFIKEGQTGGEFFRDIFELIGEVKTADAVPILGHSYASADWKRENAPLIYPNRREPSKPRALVILNFEKQELLKSSLKADYHMLMALFKNLSYQATSVQTRSKDLVRRVDSFSREIEHGDSCIVVVLSQSRDLLNANLVMEMYKSLASGAQLVGKPRLFLLNEWVRALQTDSVTDHMPTNTWEIAAEALDSMQSYWCNKDSTIKIHPHSGIIFGRSLTKILNVTEGSPFIRTLCDTICQYGCTEDVATMITRINEHNRLRNSVPIWFIQTGKLFYITDTKGLDTTSQEVSSQNSTQQGSKIKPQKVGRTGFAMILTEGSFDAVRNYQTFLEYASFRVDSDFTAGDHSSIQKAIQSVAKHIDKYLTVIVVVRRHRDDNALSMIIQELSSMSKTKSKSVLVIFCEETDKKIEIPTFQNLPDKFTVARFCGSGFELIEFLDSLLEEPRSRNRLDDCLVVGRNFRDSPAVGSVSNFISKVNDNNPEWRKPITWLSNYCVKEETSNLPSSTDVTDDELQESLIRDEFRLEKSRQYWLPELQPPPVPDPSGLPPDRRLPRALIIHNVVFGKKLSTRFGSQHDCQRLKDTMMRLGCIVSIRSNLTKAEIIEEVGVYSDNANHGSSVVLAIMSHGSLGEVFGFDGEPAKEKKILKRMASGEGTKGKQQLVIFQNCRIQNGSPDSNLSFYPGMIVAHSTCPDESSYRVNDKGSRFIQCLCAVLDRFDESHDIVSLIPIVNYVVQHSTYHQGISQLPWWSVLTNQKFYLRRNVVVASATGSSNVSRSLRETEPESHLTLVTNLLRRKDRG